MPETPEETEVNPEFIEEFFTNLPALARQVETNRTDALASFKRATEASERADAAATAATKLSRIIAFLTAFTILAFSVVSWRTEVQQGDINHGVQADRARTYAQCRVANGNATHLNEFLDQVISAVKFSTQLTPEQKDSRIKLYSAIKQKLPVCEKPDSSGN